MQTFKDFEREGLIKKVPFWTKLTDRFLKQSRKKPKPNECASENIRRRKCERTN